MNLEDYHLIVIDAGSVVYAENGRFELVPSVRTWLAKQPLRAPDQSPFIVMVEYMPITIGSRYVPMAARLTRGLPVDGAKSLFGQWPDSRVLNLCQKLYGPGRSLLLGGARLHLIAAYEARFEFCFVQKLFEPVAQIAKGKEAAAYCPRCGPGSKLVVGGRRGDKLVCRSCGYRTAASHATDLLNKGAPRLL